MTADIEMTVTEEIQEKRTRGAAKTTSLGARLKIAREAMRVTTRDVAARLHLGVNIIHAMENDDFDHSPAIFMRGYIRSYARLLNLADSEINEALDQLGMQAASTVPMIPKLRDSEVTKNEQYIRWATYLIVFVLTLLVVIWWNNHSRDNLMSDMINKATTLATPTPHQAPAPAPAAPPAPVATTQAPAPAAAPAAPAKAEPVNFEPTPKLPAPPVANATQAPAATATQEPPLATNAPNTANPVSPVSPPKNSVQMQMFAPEPGLDTSDTDSDETGHSESYGDSY